MEPEKLPEELRPYIVVNVSYVFPGRQAPDGGMVASPAFIFEPSTGKVSFSQAVLPEISSALSAALVIIKDTLNHNFSDGDENGEKGN